MTFDGVEYQLPYAGEGATGLGKPLKSILHCGEDIPIYAAFSLTTDLRVILFGKTFRSQAMLRFAMMTSKRGLYMNRSN